MLHLRVTVIYIFRILRTEWLIKLSPELTLCADVLNPIDKASSSQRVIQRTFWIPMHFFVRRRSQRYQKSVFLALLTIPARKDVMDGIFSSQ